MFLTYLLRDVLQKEVGTALSDAAAMAVKCDHGYGRRARFALFAPKLC